MGQQQTPQKRQRHVDPFHPASFDPYDAPRSASKTPIHERTCVGPTPQKDGIVLGLFDLLSPRLKGVRTPSKHGARALKPLAFNTCETASRRQLDEPQYAGCGMDGAENGQIKSPKSFARDLVDPGLVTPSARHTLDSPTKHTPNSVQHRRESNSFTEETPAFLKRESRFRWIAARSSTTNENTTFDSDPVLWTPVKPRVRPMPTIKSLSALVKGLQKIEDQKLDDDMEMLREIETGGISNVIQPPAERVLVSDSQAIDMPSVADNQQSHSDDKPETTPLDGKPLKVWKKKGQKRTTRKVDIKPSRTAWKPDPVWKGESESEASGEEVDGVVETQCTTLITKKESTVSEDITAQDNELGDYQGSDLGKGDAKRERELNKSLKGGSYTETKCRTNARAKPIDGKGGKQNSGSKKKISATAHPNFRALKIKNKNSKGRGRGRFGRRR